MITKPPGVRGGTTARGEIKHVRQHANLIAKSYFEIGTLITIF
jgi:hypothetical protein